jgi:hypothetical protein
MIVYKKRQTVKNQVSKIAHVSKINVRQQIGEIMPKRRVALEKELGQRVTFRLDLPCYSQLMDYASSEGFTPSTIVRRLVKRFLANQRRLSIDPMKGISL